ncbi:hypothetical protein O7635_07570 [Asanoa sp. WMMD1127]|uniref:hypothetical protein n=1 Tax=Asanoa sp. WMMD1127 TaxID=3016107 RepID=UPI002416D74D|nr:hypothetical protein [Asanoa sp. WMMD1127]MDG4821710.1 hypothetical protein [Asanoa sp. WMMD1127]
MPTLRKKLLVVLSTLATAATLLVFAPAAQAAPAQCRGNTKAFSNGYATAQRNITVRLCVHRIDSDTVWAYAELETGAKRGSADLFYHFHINVRLERYDSDLATNTCIASDAANSGSQWGFMLSCPTTKRNTTVTGGWTADGNVSYDIVGDGKNDLTWSLTGSPMID